MNRLSTAKRVQILASLVEGNSLRATSRMVGVSINTVSKFLVDLGRECAKYQGEVMRNLPCERLQVDEIWAFCYAKAKNVPKEMEGQFGVGDVWTWTAICADTKLVPTWFTGDRGAGSAWEFMQDLAPRMARRVQLTSDGHKVYLEAVDEAFRGQVDFAQLVKIYGRDESEPETRYSPAKCNGAKKEPRIGNPDPDHISTSYAERQNLTMRMSMRRFTRLTNRFSKKVENHANAIAIHFMYYNFGRIHKTLQTTPAMAAGVSNHVWSLAEIVGLLN
jgi:IS1 family transposase/lambda repressor-like predicted transcriptional regulator